MTLHLQEEYGRGALCGVNQLSTETTAYEEEVTCKNCLRFMNAQSRDKLNNKNSSFLDTDRDYSNVRRRDI